MKIQPKGKIYSTNEGNYKYLSTGVQKYIDSKKFPEVCLVFSNALSGYVQDVDLEWENF